MESHCNNCSTLDRLVLSTCLSLRLNQAYCVVMDRAHTDMSTSPVDNSRYSSGLLDLQVMYVLWESRAAVQWGSEKWENLVIACCKIEF